MFCISLTVSDVMSDFCAAQIQGRIWDYITSVPGQMSRSDFNRSVLAVYLQRVQK